jgi:hypothetical protein
MACLGDFLVRPVPGALTCGLIAGPMRPIVSMLFLSICSSMGSRYVSMLSVGIDVAL